MFYLLELPVPHLLRRSEFVCRVCVMQFVEDNMQAAIDGKAQRKNETDRLHQSTVLCSEVSV